MPVGVDSNVRFLNKLTWLRAKTKKKQRPEETETEKYKEQKKLKWRNMKSRRSWNREKQRAEEIETEEYKEQKKLKPRKIKSRRNWNGAEAVSVVDLLQRGRFSWGWSHSFTATWNICIFCNIFYCLNPNTQFKTFGGNPRMFPNYLWEHINWTPNP